MSKLFHDLMNSLDEVEAFLSENGAGCRVTLPAEIDVKRIRQNLNMTQARFSDTFGFSLDAVKHWESGRRTPEASARAFLTVIDRDPHAVVAALHPIARRSSARSPAVTGARRRKGGIGGSPHQSSVCTSTDSTAGRSRTIAFHELPESADAYTCPPVVPK